MDLERGLAALKKQAAGTWWYSDFLTQEAALLLKIQEERHYGPSQQTQQDRIRIIEQLNTLSLEHLHISFNDLCQGRQVPSPPHNEASSITTPAPSSNPPSPDFVHNLPPTLSPKITHNLPPAPLSDIVPATSPNRPFTSAPVTRFHLSHVLPNQASVLTLAFSPDGETLASGGSDGKIKLWSWSEAKLQQSILECHCPIQTMVFSPIDEKILVSGHDDGTIRVWNLDAHTLCYPVITGHSKCVTSVAISYDGKILASGSYDGIIKLWTLSDGKQWHSPLAPETFAGRLLNPLKRILKPLVAYEPHILSVTFDPHNKILASGHDDKTIWLWDLDSEKAPRILNRHLGEVLHVMINADGKLISGSKNDEFRVWNLPDRELVNAFSLGAVLNSAEKVETVAISSDGNIVANGDHKGTIKLLHLDTMVAQTLHAEGEVWSLAFSPRERLLASGGGENGKIQIWREQDTPPIYQQRQSVFISYSHQDIDSQLELRTHLAYYARKGVVEYWDDTKIGVGEKWYEAIQQAIQNTKIAILLISPDFFASEFIAQHELPWLLGAAERKEITIFCVILRQSSFEHTELARFQTVNSPSTPLIDMSIGNRDKVWKKVADLVRDRLQTNG